MRSHFWYVVAMPLIAGALQAQTPSQPPVPGAPTAAAAFVNVAVIPMDTERVLTNHTVLVEHGRITALGPMDQVKIPAGAMRIDGRGQYLMPGLTDMHAHFKGVDSVLLERQLLLYLADGVTTVRSLDQGASSQVGADEERRLRFKARAAAGTIPSPRLYVSGTWWQIDPATSSRAKIPPEHVATYLAAYKKQGFDHIKLYGQQVNRELLDSTIAAARRLGLPLIGHAWPSEMVERIVATYRSIEHLSGYITYATEGDSVNGSKLATMVAASQRPELWICPTQALNERAKTPESHLTLTRRLIKTLQDAGARLLVGTDHSIRVKDVITVHDELRALVAAGLTPYQALLAGTRNAADYFGTLAETGTVAVGKRADLMLVQGNPLENIRNAAQPTGVILGGRWFSRAELDRKLADSKAAIPSTP